MATVGLSLLRMRRRKADKGGRRVRRLAASICSWRWAVETDGGDVATSWRAACIIRGDRGLMCGAAGRVGIRPRVGSIVGCVLADDCPDSSQLGTSALSCCSGCATAAMAVDIGGASDTVERAGDGTRLGIRTPSSVYSCRAT